MGESFVGAQQPVIDYDDLTDAVADCRLLADDLRAWAQELWTALRLMEYSTPYGQRIQAQIAAICLQANGLAGQCSDVLVPELLTAKAHAKVAADAALAL